MPTETVDRIVQLAMSPPPAGRSRWTTRLLRKELDLTSGCISDVIRKNGLKPHLVRTYKVSRDPEFAAKVSDLVGLYLNPPEHAVVLSVDEKTSIQALQRTQLPLPLRSGRAARHTHNYKRHGVVDLYAALEIATGNVTHRVTESHTGADFLAFMKTVVRRYSKQQLHVVLDNSSTHGTPDVKAWLAANPRVHFHYTSRRRCTSATSYPCPDVRRYIWFAGSRRCGTRVCSPTTRQGDDSDMRCTPGLLVLGRRNGPPRSVCDCAA